MLTPVWAGLATSLALTLPFLAPILLPLAAARMTRAAIRLSMERAKPFGAMLYPVLVLPAALVFGQVLTPMGGLAATIVAVAFVALPSVGLFAGCWLSRTRAELVILTAGLSGACALAMQVGGALATGQTAGAQLSAVMGQMIPDLIATWKSAGWPPSNIEAMNQAFSLTRSAIETQLPGLALGFSVVFAAILVYVFAPVWGELAPGEPFVKFRTPLAAVLVFVPVGLLATLAPAGLRHPAVDILIPLAVLFFLRGLAIIRALLEGGRIGLLGRAIVYFLVFQMPLPLILALGGLFDEFFDFRGRLEKATEGRS